MIFFDSKLLFLTQATFKHFSCKIQKTTFNVEEGGGRQQSTDVVVSDLHLPRVEELYQRGHGRVVYRVQHNRLGPRGVHLVSEVVVSCRNAREVC